MAKALVRGAQIKTVDADNIAPNAVITEKIKDNNVTYEKLEPGLQDRLLSNPFPIARIKISESLPERADFEIPNGLMYNLNTFVERVAIYRNGQLLFNGLEEPINEDDPVEVFPGSDTTKIKFDMMLRKGDTIQVIIL